MLVHGMYRFEFSPGRITSRRLPDASYIAYPEDGIIPPQISIKPLVQAIR